MRACILGCASTSLGAEEQRFFRDADPFGFIVFARNCRDRDQLRRLTGELRDAVGREAPILVDEEGGRVQRMKPPCWRNSPAPGRFGEIYGRDPQAALDLARINARLIADDLFEVGIDVNCAPLLDLREPNGHVVIGDRAFSSETAIVVDLAKAWIAGLNEGGVIPVVKHMPGHGRSRVDSHDALPVVDTSLAELEARDFVPFRALRDAPAGMTGHLLFEAIDPEQPSTLSAKLIREVIRQSIGFDGLLMSDDVSMSALEGTIGERAARSIAAGCDIALHCNGEMPEMLQVVDRVPDLSGEALRRAAAIVKASEAARSGRRPADGGALLDRFETHFAKA